MSLGLSLAMGGLGQRRREVSSFRCTRPTSALPKGHEGVEPLRPDRKGTLRVRPSANLRTTDDDALVCSHFLCNSFDQSFNPEFARGRHAQAFNFAGERHGLIGVQMDFVQGVGTANNRVHPHLRPWEPRRHEQRMQLDANPHVDTGATIGLVQP